MPSSLNPSVINNQSIPARNSSNVQVVINGQGKFKGNNVRLFLFLPILIATGPTLAPKDVKTPGPQRKAGTQNATKSQTKSGKQAGEQSSSGSDSDDSIEIHVPAPEEPSPIPSQRPSEPLAAARYDTLHAVWSPRNRRPNADKVKNALVAFKNVVKAVRDTWKDNTQAMKAAENKGETDKETQLKKQVVLQRRLMDVVVSTTLEMGHPTIVEKYVFFLIVFLALVTAFSLAIEFRSELRASPPVIFLAWILSMPLIKWPLSKGERILRGPWAIIRNKEKSSWVPELSVFSSAIFKWVV